MVFKRRWLEVVMAMLSLIVAGGAWWWLGPVAAVALLTIAALVWQHGRVLRQVSVLEYQHRRQKLQCERFLRRAERAEHKHREMRLTAKLAQAQRHRLLEILNAFHDAVLVTDAFNELVLANDAARRLLELTESADARPLDRVLTDASLVKLIKDTREGGCCGPRCIERQMGEATYDVSLNVVDDDDVPLFAGPDDQRRSDHRGVVTILRDVTRRKEIEQLKNEFVSNVSHELRTPLASIQAYLEMLVDGEAADEQSRCQFYLIMQSEAGRLSRLIENMLNLGRLEAGLMKPHPEMVALPPLIQQAVEVMRPQAQLKEIELIVQAPLYEEPIHVDRDMILQVLVNLLGNAVKYTPQGGCVTVGVRREPDHPQVEVWVRDNGIGIAPADQARLFDKFYRAEAGARTARGTGLGLSLVRRIIRDLHGGQVSVKSEPGQGSTFTFSLPMAEVRNGQVP